MRDDLFAIPVLFVSRFQPPLAADARVIERMGGPEAVVCAVHVPISESALGHVSSDDLWKLPEFNPLSFWHVSRVLRRWSMRKFNQPLTVVPFPFPQMYVAPRAGGSSPILYRPTALSTFLPPARHVLIWQHSRELLEPLGDLGILERVAVMQEESVPYGRALYELVRQSDRGQVPDVLGPELYQALKEEGLLPVLSRKVEDLLSAAPNLSRILDAGEQARPTFLEIDQEKRRSAPGTGASMELVDIGIVIALHEEFRELFRDIEHDTKPIIEPALGQYYYLFERATGRGRPFKGVATSIGQMGPTKAAAVTERLLARFNPKTIAMVGIAAGIHSDVKLGDVAVARQVDEYLSSAKAGPATTGAGFDFQLGGEVYRGSEDLVNAASNLEFAFKPDFGKWQAQCWRTLLELVGEPKATELVTSDLARREPHIEPVHLASGPVVGAAEAFSEWLHQKGNRNYKALDMESGGVMASATSRSEGMRTLILRGISDYGDERKKKLEAVGKGALRTWAMRNALQLLWTLLEAGVLPRHTVLGG